MKIKGTPWGPEAGEAVFKEIDGDRDFNGEVPQPPDADVKVRRMKISKRILMWVFKMTNTYRWILRCAEIPLRCMIVYLTYLELPQRVNMSSMTLNQQNNMIYLTGTRSSKLYSTDRSLQFKISKESTHEKFILL